MKTFSALFFVLCLLMGCNPPRDQRTSLNLRPHRAPANLFPQELIPENEQEYPPPLADTGDDDDDDEQRPPSNDGFSHCRQLDDSASPPYRQKHDSKLGTIDLCQNSTNQLEVAIRANIHHQTRRVCVVPTSRGSNNSSVHIGNAVCERLKSENWHFITLNKHPSRQNSPLNGAMLLFEDLLYDYRNCIVAPPSQNQIPCNYFKSRGGYYDFNFL